jgi:hypothetical protein
MQFRYPASQPDGRTNSGLGRFPAAIVALGSSNEPAPRLLAVQSAGARGIAMLAACRLSGLHLPRPARLGLRAQ